MGYRYNRTECCRHLRRRSSPSPKVSGGFYVFLLTLSFDSTVLLFFTVLHLFASLRVEVAAAARVGFDGGRDATAASVCGFVVFLIVRIWDKDQ